MSLFRELASFVLTFLALAAAGLAVAIAGLLNLALDGLSSSD